MAKKQQKSLRIVRRFGTRYGRTIRNKLADIEVSQKATYKCPYCNYVRVKRESAGIWNCSKCGAKFASKAYSVSKMK